MIIIRKGNYQLTTISRLKVESTDDSTVVEELPISEGVSLDMTMNEGLFYVTIAMIKYDAKEKSPCICKDVCYRLLDVPEEDWNLVKSLLRAAIELVDAANVEG